MSLLPHYTTRHGPRRSSTFKWGKLDVRIITELAPALHNPAWAAAPLFFLSPSIGKRRPLICSRLVQCIGADRNSGKVALHQQRLPMLSRVCMKSDCAQSTIGEPSQNLHEGVPHVEG